MNRGSWSTERRFSARPPDACDICICNGRRNCFVLVNCNSIHKLRMPCCQMKPAFSARRWPSAHSPAERAIREGKKLSPRSVVTVMRALMAQEEGPVTSTRGSLRNRMWWIMVKAFQSITDVSGHGKTMDLKEKTLIGTRMKRCYTQSHQVRTTSSALLAAMIQDLEKIRT